MNSLTVHDVLTDKILVSRESARLLEQSLRVTMADSSVAGDGLELSPVSIDFRGVEGIAPSFLDELLSIFETLLGTARDERRLIVVNPPTRLSLKFEAIARGHGMSIQALQDGSWLLSNTKSCDGA